MKSPNKERAAFSMGCLLERSLPHLIPGAWKRALRLAPSPGLWQTLLYKGDFQQRARGGRQEKKGECGMEDPCPFLLPNGLLMVK